MKQVSYHGLHITFKVVYPLPFVFHSCVNVGPYHVCFRTPGTGLYDNIQKYNLPYAEAIFDIDYFSHDPKPFYCLAQELYPSGVYRPNISHYFVRLLHEKGLLHRMYTQNIDGLERCKFFLSPPLFQDKSNALLVFEYTLPQ